MKLFFLSLLITLLCACPSMTAQSPAYTTVTATLTDGQGQTWANASYVATFQPPFNNPAHPTNNGTDVISPVTGFANASGVITQNLDDTSVVTPSGGIWQFTICPNASTSNCSSASISTHGGSQNSSAILSAALQPISVSVVPVLQRAYTDTEVSSSQGGIYWRVSDNTLRGFNGSSWQAVGSGGGGGVSTWDQLGAPLNNLTLSMSNFLTNFQWGSATGNGSPDLDLSDSNTNNGTNALLRIHTGTTSNSTPFEACAQGLSNCVMFTTSGVFQPIGSAQIIATSVNNGTAGIGTLDLGSNGAGSLGNTNQVRLTGNFNKLYVGENASGLYKAPLRVYTNGATITQTGDTTEHTIYSINNFPAQLADGAFRITLYWHDTTQGAGTSQFRIKVNGTFLAGSSIVTAQQGSDNQWTTTTWMGAATNNEWNQSFYNSNAALAIPIIVGNTAIDMSTISTMTITFQGANNGDAITFHGIVVEEL